MAQEVAKARATLTGATKHARQGKCTYGKECKFKHEAGASKGASARQLSVEALENSTAKGNLTHGRS